MSVETVTLKKIRVAMSKLIAEDLLLDAQLDIENAVVDGFRLTLAGYLLGEDIQRKEVRYPKDWLQAFKERWFSDWAKRRWPVQYRTTVLDAKLLYTEFKPALPDQPYRIDVSKWSHDD